MLFDMAWSNIHNKVHGLQADYRPLEETKTIIKGLEEREERGELDPLSLSVPVLNAYKFYKKHKSIINV